MQSRVHFSISFTLHSQVHFNINFMERKYCNGYVPSPKLKTEYKNQFWSTALQTFSFQQTDGERKKSRIIYPPTSPSAQKVCKNVSFGVSRMGLGSFVDINIFDMKYYFILFLHILHFFESLKS